MTDQGNNGNIPPPPNPTAPPPLAAASPPVPPAAQPAPAPYYPSPARSGPGLWPLFVFLAFALGVGGTILTLWLTGQLWNSQSSSYSSPGSGSASSNGMGASAPMPSTPAPAPAPTTTPASGYPPTPDTLTGTWGPGCPGSTDDGITFYDDGTAMSDGENGTWTLDGSYVNLNNGRETLALYWEMVSNDSARVRRSGTSQTRMVYRCP